MTPVVRVQIADLGNRVIKANGAFLDNQGFKDQGAHLGNEVILGIEEKMDFLECLAHLD